MVARQDITPMEGTRYRERFQALGDFRFCYEAFCRMGVWSRKRLDRALQRFQSGDTMERKKRDVVPFKRLMVLAFLDLLKREETYARACCEGFLRFSSLLGLSSRPLLSSGLFGVSFTAPALSIALTQYLRSFEKSVSSREVHFVSTRNISPFLFCFVLFL